MVSKYQNCTDLCFSRTKLNLNRNCLHGQNGICIFGLKMMMKSGQENFFTPKMKNFDKDFISTKQKDGWIALILSVIFSATSWSEMEKGSNFESMPFYCHSGHFL